MSTGVRLVDVARRAGVSSATASLVLNERGSRSVSIATKIRVREAAAALDFAGVANDSATSGPLGLLLLVDRDAGLGLEVVTHAQAIAEGYGPSAILVEVADISGEDPGLVERLVARGAKRVLIVSKRRRVVAQRIPTFARVAFVNCFPPLGSETGGCAIVLVDEASAAIDVVGGLVRVGHPRIGIVFGDSGREVSGDWATGARVATDRSGLPSVPSLIALHHHSAKPLVRLLARSNPNRPSALVCLDEMAAEAVEEAASAVGLKIPTDLSVVFRCDSMEVQAPTLGVSVSASIVGLLEAGLRAHREAYSRASRRMNVRATIHGGGSVAAPRSCP